MFLLFVNVKNEKPDHSVRSRLQKQYRILFVVRKQGKEKMACGTDDAFVVDKKMKLLY